jgi:hypothetical protein
MRPPHRFRLFPESQSVLFVVVNVWATQADMLKYAGEDDARVGGESTHGFCGGIEIIDFKRGKPARKQPVFAEVNLYRSRLGMNVITHEFFHATMAWGRRVRFQWSQLGDDDKAVTKDEERMSYVHGRLCAEFTRRAIAAGLYS